MSDMDITAIQNQIFKVTKILCLYLKNLNPALKWLFAGIDQTTSANVGNYCFYIMYNLSVMKNIILCIDGEKWTEKAINYAIEITRAFNGRLTALHVINPYLKKFADEIYAVGRIEYKNHIEKELGKEAENIIAGLKAIVEPTGLSYNVILRYGPPEEEIIKEISENSYDLLILGAKPLDTLKEKIGSFNLPKKIFKNMQIPTLFVR